MVADNEDTLMRGPAYAVAALAVALVLSIALFGHKPTYTTADLQARCEDTTENMNRNRIRACRSLLRRYVFAPWYRGAINSQLCAAFGKGEYWKKAVDACTNGNDPWPQYANYVNRAVAYDMLGEHDKAQADRTEAALLKPLPPVSK